MSRALFLLGALPFVALGTIHTLVTPLRTSDQKGLSPADPALREAMTQQRLLLTRRTDLWRASVGFNLSHSLGAVLFGLVVLPAGRSRFAFAADAPLFLPLAVVVSGTYLILGLRYWFREPVIGISLSLACFLAARARVNKRSTEARPEATIEANRPQMPDALVPVVRGGHESQRSAMLERQGLAVEYVREQDVVGDHISQGQAGGKPVGTLEPEVPDRGIRIHARRDQLPVDIGKAVPTPTDPQATPGRHAMKVRDLLPPGQRGEIGDGDLAGRGDVSDDPEHGPRGGPGPTPGEGD